MSNYIIYQVIKGDTLSDIAARMLGQSEMWTKIFAANRDQIDDPNLILPGQSLRIPFYHSPQHPLDEILSGISAATAHCHANAVAGGWWNDLETGAWKDRNKGELLMLIVSEIAEAMEGARKDINDDHLPHRKMLEVELADALIRIFDFAGAFKLDLAAAMLEKLAYNAQRTDHKPANRVLAGGKKF